MPKITTQSFKDAMQIISPTINITGKYVSSKTKIACKCKKCNHEFAARPQDLKRKKASCTKCSGKYRPTPEEFIQEMLTINPTINILSPYITNKKKVQCECIKCGHTWKQSPNVLKTGSGCIKCAGVYSPTHAEFSERLYLANKNIVAIGTYSGASATIPFKCLLCNGIWNTTPSNILNCGSGCHHCAGAYKRTPSEFVYQMKNISPTIKILENFKNVDTPILCSCITCNHEWRASPDNLLYAKSNCPECLLTRRNISESEICNLIIQEFDITAIREFKLSQLIDSVIVAGSKNLRYDLFSKKYNLAVEYMGRQHYEPLDFFGGIDKFNATVKRDEAKRLFSAQNNIHQIDIKYSTYNKSMTNNEKDSAFSEISQCIKEYITSDSPPSHIVI